MTRALPKPENTPGDPVSIYIRDNAYRVATWTSGKAGTGERVWVTRRSLAEAEALRADIRRKLHVRSSLGPAADLKLADLFTKFLKGTNSKFAAATRRDYASRWNRHMLEAIAGLPCHELEAGHWSAIFDGMVESRASEGTIKKVHTMLSSLLSFGEERGCFGDAHPFGLSKERRAAIVRRARKNSPATQRRGPQVHNQIPSPREIASFADSADHVLPGYGRNLVLLSLATGLRIGECLGLRMEHIDPASGQIRVVQQVTSGAAWPTTSLPKSQQTRTVRIWEAYRELLTDLLTVAATHDGDHAGWLFPPDTRAKLWADRVNRLLNQGAVAHYNKNRRAGDREWTWTFHWMRHSFATYSIDHYGLAPSYVQGELGHAKLSTTLDHYVNQTSGQLEAARRATSKPL